MPTYPFSLPSSKCAVRGLTTISLVTASAAEAARPPATKLFKVGRRSLEGRDKTICVIEGKWAGGEYFRYGAWDSCSKMYMRRVTEKEYKDAPSLGAEKDPTVADILKGAEVLERENGVSKTLIFRDLKGEQREILSGD